MTPEDFDKQKWGVDMKCIYENVTRDIISVDFPERLVGLVYDSDDTQIQWVRCENIKLIK